LVGPPLLSASFSDYLIWGQAGLTGDTGADATGQASSIGVYEIAVGKRAKAFIAEKL